MDGGLFESTLSMSNEALYLVACAMLLPWLLAVVNRRRWPPEAKVAAAVLVSFVAAGLWYLLREGWDTGQWVRASLVVVVLTAAIYRLYKPALDKLEDRTG